MRHYIVLLHRYVGLTMVAFLLIAGVTGSLIVWHQELDAGLNPAMLKVTPPTADARPLDPLVLRDKVLAAYPLVLSEYVPQKVAPDQVLMFYVYGKPDSAKGEYVELPVSSVNANINNEFD